MEKVLKLAKEMAEYCKESVVGSLPNQHHPSAIRRVAQAVIAALLLGKGVIPNRGKFWSKDAM